VDETLDRIDVSTIASGDVVGIGLHTGNALRGYEIGRQARKRGAWALITRTTLRCARIADVIVA
jgi:hypothetical protein